MTTLLACAVTLESLHLRLTARPWRRAVNPGMFRKIEFPHRCVPSPQLALADYAAAIQLSGWVFFDRGLIDSAAALEHMTGEPTLVTLGNTYRYYDRVFVTPPWREIYIKDSERRHGFDDAVAEFERLIEVYPSLGYEVVMLPKVGTVERADFIMRALNT